MRNGGCLQQKKIHTHSFIDVSTEFSYLFPTDPCNPQPRRVATTGHHEPATADPFGFSSLSLSLYRICWESQWSVLGCLAIASAMQAKDDKTAFLKCPTFLILGSRQTNQACGFRERVLSSRSSETFPYLSTSKASPIEMTSPI